MATKKGVVKIPKSLGEAVDLFYTLRQQRLEVEKRADEIKEQETALSEYLSTTFGKDKLNGASGKVGTVRVKQVQVPRVKDWDKFWGYVFKTRDTALLQKRCNDAAFRELWAAGKKVPGVDKFEFDKVSVTKLGGGNGDEE